MVREDRSASTTGVHEYMHMMLPRFASLTRIVLQAQGLECSSLLLFDNVEVWSLLIALALQTQHRRSNLVRRVLQYSRHIQLR